MRRSIFGVVVAFVTISLASADNLDRFCTNAPNNIFVRSPRSCQHWIFCQNGRAIEGQCGGIYHFDPDYQMCRYAEYVQCDMDAIQINCPVVGLELHPHPRYCDQYVACINGFPRVINCAPELHWDQERQMCDVPANVGCTIEEEKLDYVCEPNQVYIAPHPTDCQQFLVCINGKRIVNQCADHLLFDPQQLRCDAAENVNCVLPEASVDYECDPNRDFYFAIHPNSCHYYIMCFAGQRQIQRCADNLLFDWLNLRCDLAENAICLAPRLV